MALRVNSVAAMIVDTTGGKSGVMKAGAISAAQSADLFTVAGTGWLTAVDTRIPTFLLAPATATSGRLGTTTAGYGFLERGAFADGLGSIVDMPTDVATGTTASLPSGVVVSDSKVDSTDAVNLKS